MKSAARRVALPLSFVILSAGVVALSGAPVQQSAERSLVVDFYALGADGASISDLKPEETTIRVNGRARTLQSLRLVKQSELPSTELATRPAASLEPFGTNGVAEAGRSFVVIIEDESFRSGREKPIREAMSAFLGAIYPKDRVSLWTVPHGGMKVNLTTNHDRIHEATQIIVGHGPEGETSQDAACRTRNTLLELDQLLSTLAGGEGPTTIILLTNSMMGPRRDAPMSKAPGMCELTTELFTRVGKMAASARAHFFIVQPEDLIPGAGISIEAINGAGFNGSANPFEGIENLAGVTGATRLALSRAGNTSLVSIARATASYYSAVVDGASSDVEGGLSLDVKVSRPGVAVKSRPTIFIRKPTGVVAKPPTPEEMMKVSTVFADLPLRVTGFSSMNGDGRMRVIAAAEPADANTKITALSVGLFDSDGRLVAQVSATEEELTAQPILAGMVVSKGIYRLRAAAVDEKGRAGAADTEVVVDVVQAGPLQLSSLVLGLNRDGGFKPRLQFSNEPLGIAYVDVFGGTPGAAVAAIIEVAQTLTGPPIAVNRLSIEPTKDPGRVTARGAIPLGALPPGDYVARVWIGVEGQPIGRVYRAFRKVGQ